MNKPILMPQLTATRARTGMNRVGDLIALLIKQYELQDQLRQNQRRQTKEQPKQPGPRQQIAPVKTSVNKREGQASAIANRAAAPETARPAMTAQFANAKTKGGKSTPVQATFAWFDATSTEPAGV